MLDTAPVTAAIIRLIAAGVAEGELIATVARHYIEQRIQFRHGKKPKTRS